MRAQKHVAGKGLEAGECASIIVNDSGILHVAQKLVIWCTRAADEDHVITVAILFGLRGPRSAALGVAGSDAGRHNGTANGHGIAVGYNAVGLNGRELVLVSELEVVLAAAGDQVSVLFAG